MERAVRHLGRMSNPILRPAWWQPENRVTPESVFLDRRRFLGRLGLIGAGLSAAPRILGAEAAAAAGAAGGGDPYARGYPHARAKDFDPGWKLTDEKVASTYNNFYEFSLRKDVHRHVAKFETAPWKVEIGGLVEKPMAIDAAELIAKMPLEERVYRFRCVEAWAMVVPWTGFSFAKLAALVQPKSEAKFVRFVTAAKPEQMPGIRENPEYPWPYFEGLRMEEALHPLTMVVTGIYGKPLAKQFGAPLRIVVPWKYGYKSPKSVVKIEFIATQPKTFWETLIPREYPFESNVDPEVPHPRWSQATERMIDSGDRVKTKKYNGYGDQVAKLYGA
jgi:sulfoxide reductase catalytic subunit YedY